VNVTHFWLFVGVAVAVLVLAGGVYAYDRDGRDLIAKGVTASGVDVGGLSERDARELLRQRLPTALDHPVVVRYGSRRFVLSARRAGVRVDVDAMTDGAVRRSRDGDIVSRTWRRLTGGERRLKVPLIADASPATIGRFVREVERAVERRPRNADVELVRKDVRVRRARPGRRLHAAEQLRRRIESVLLTPGPQPSLVARAERVAPEVPTDKLADRHPYLIVIDREDYRLRVYRRLRRAETFRIGLGRTGFETPAGRYEVINKAKNPAWHVPDKDWAGELAGRVIPGGTPQNPLKARWLGLTKGGVGIHGTDEEDSIGRRASHGCIRMLVPDVKRLYRRIDVGTAVFIA
jgi:lipoprotein-anchoring transpeptidase ErfK/SrfK